MVKRSTAPCWTTIRAVLTTILYWTLSRSGLDAAANGFHAASVMMRARPMLFKHGRLESFLPRRFYVEFVGNRSLSKTISFAVTDVLPAAASLIPPALIIMIFISKWQLRRSMVQVRRVQLRPI